MQWADDVLIDLFQSLHFFVGSSLVRGFIRGLDMNHDQIGHIILQGFDGRPSFGRIVRVEISRCPIHFDHGPAEQPAEAAQEIDSGNHGTSLVKSLLKRWQRWTLPLPPEPALSGGVNPGGRSSLICRAGGKERATLVHDLA